MKPKVLILGAGFAGHTAALHLSRLAHDKADITVISPRNRFTWFPSLIWVATGNMSPEECHFELGPVYAKIGVDYVAGKATAIYVHERYVVAELDAGGTRRFDYDYLVNATGPYLNFEGTPGLGPSTGNTVSVCGVEHATGARDAYLETVKAMRGGARRRLVIGVGHPMATCEGAAFEYLMNVDADLRHRRLRDRAELIWLSNEPEPGDFGVDGIETLKHGRLVTGASVVRGLLDEHDIRIIMPAGVTKVEPGVLIYEQAAMDPGTLQYDFAMLIPQFRGIPLRYVASDGTDISKEMTQPSGFMSVDAKYEPKAYDVYNAADWPSIYQSPRYDNIYAAGIAFAPPHPLSKPKKSATGAAIVATPPRTGMASGIMGRTVALNIVDQLKGLQPHHGESMSEMPAACIASMGNSLINGSAASIIMVPMVRDYGRYPKYGRDLSLSELDVGLGGAWTKRLLHSAFLWKLKARPGWTMIPE